MATIGTRSPAQSSWAKSSPSTFRRRTSASPLSQPRQRERPSHWTFVGCAEVGAAWSKRSAEQRDYLSVELDGPSFNAPIYANLVQDEDGEGFDLIWSRSRKANSD